MSIKLPSAATKHSRQKSWACLSDFGSIICNWCLSFVFFLSRLLLWWRHCLPLSFSEWHLMSLVFRIQIAVAYNDVFPFACSSSRLRLNMNTYLLIWTPFLYFLGQACLLSKDSLMNPSKQINNCNPVHLFSLFLNTIYLRERIYAVTENRLPPS